MKSILALAGLALFPSLSLAQEAPAPHLYGSVGYGVTEMDKAKLDSLQGRLGYQFSPHFGVEAEAGLGLKEDDVLVGSTPVSAKIQSEFAAYGVGRLALTPKLDLLARAGLGTTDIKGAVAGGTQLTDGQSLNGGIGAEYRLDEQNGIRLDYTRKEYQRSEVGADTWAIGYVRRF